MTAESLCGPGFETSLPAREECVGRYLLERHARQAPDRVFAEFLDGDPWTFADLHREAARVAHALSASGIGRGDYVLAWLTNSREALAVWFGATALGAVIVPISTAYRGHSLAHALASVPARLLIADGSLMGGLRDDSLASVETMVVVGDDPGWVAPPGVGFCHYKDWTAPAAGDAFPELAVPIEPWEPQCVLFTSGTTGPSKAVLSSYFHQYATMQTSMRYLGSEDRAFVPTPLSHVSGAGSVTVMLAKGGSIAFVDGFSTSRFWREIRTSGSTFAQMIGAMANFLDRLEPSDDERATPLRHIHLAPVTEVGLRLCRRVGATPYSSFNMTEISSPLLTLPHAVKPLVCGRPRPGVEVRLVDANDLDVAEGEIGELVVRTALPWSMASGYLGRPDAVAQAWRNGWFHCGDSFRRDPDGDFVFVDRNADRIRRRGENISSYEIEVAAGSHPQVREVAAVGVASADSEEEVLLVLVADDPYEPEALLAHLVERLPYFMVPRYLRRVQALPKTMTERVRKQQLRASGLDAADWDRERAGLRVDRRGLSRVD